MTTSEIYDFKFIIDVPSMDISWAHIIDDSAFIITINNVPVILEDIIIVLNHGQYSYIIKNFEMANYRLGKGQEICKFEKMSEIDEGKQIYQLTENSRIMDIYFGIPDTVEGPISCKIIRGSSCLQNRGPLMTVLPSVQYTKREAPKNMYLNDGLFEFFKNVARNLLEEEHTDTIFQYLPANDVTCIDQSRNNVITLSNYKQTPFSELNMARIRYSLIGECYSLSVGIKRDYDLYCIPYDDNFEEPQKIQIGLCKEEDTFHIRPNIVKFETDESGLLKIIRKDDNFKIKCNFCCTPSHYGRKKCFILFLMFVPMDRSKPVIISICRSFTSSVYKTLKRKR